MDGGGEPTEALLPQRDSLEFLEPVSISSAIDDCVLEKVAIGSMVIDGRLSATIILKLFDLPRVSLLVVDQARIVVPFVHVLQDGGEDFRFLISQVDALVVRRVCIHVHVRQVALEPRRCTQDIFVGGEDALVSSDNEGDNGRCQGAV